MKKKLLAIATCLCMLTSLLPAVALAAEYSDTAGHWAEESIARWSDAGVVQGSNGQFNPDGMMTRAEAAQVFANLLKLTGKADLSAYTDVAADAWYADAFAACVAQGIMNGVAADQMNPNGTVTREMFFVMFARALGIQEESSLKGDFTDASEISSWAKGYVYALVNNGYVNGTADGVISPKLNINRASVMALLDQTIVSYIVADGAATVNSDGVVLVLADDVTLSGSGDVTVAVASEGAQVDLEGMTGEVAVVVLEDDVAITNAPEGTVITVADDVAGTTVNGEAAAAGEEIVIPEEQPAPSGGGGGGSTGGGGGSIGGGGGGEEKRPTITVGNKDYVWDDDKEEYIYVDGDGKEEILVPDDITGGIEDQEESTVVVVDDKEYYYDAEEKEWFEIIGDDEEESVSPDQVEDALNGGATNDQDPVA